MNNTVNTPKIIFSFFNKSFLNKRVFNEKEDKSTHIAPNEICHKFALISFPFKAKGAPKNLS